jgi:hypothetical protein
VDSTQESVLPPFFGDWRQSENLSEIKPPLVCLPSYFRLIQCLWHPATYKGGIIFEDIFHLTPSPKKRAKSLSVTF